MHVLSTSLDPKDAFVVAIRNAFQRAGVPLLDRRPGETPGEESVVRLEMQVDGVTALASVPLQNPSKRHEFLEENPDILQIVVGDLLVRHQSRRGV
jgi:hypothetical protein